MTQPRWDLCAIDLIATDWETVEAEYKKMEDKR